MENKNISYKTDKITLEELKQHLYDTKDDFEMQEYYLIESYALKLFNNANFTVARNSEGKLAGIIAFYDNHTPTSFISHIWVSKLYRRHGICSNMLSLTQETVKEKGFTALRLEVRSDNESAIRAYLKSGFIHISEIDNKITMQKAI